MEDLVPLVDRVGCNFSGEQLMVPNRMRQYTQACSDAHFMDLGSKFVQGKLDGAWACPSCGSEPSRWQPMVPAGMGGAFPAECCNMCDAKRYPMQALERQVVITEQRTASKNIQKDIMIDSLTRQVESLQLDAAIGKEVIAEHSCLKVYYQRLLADHEDLKKARASDLLENSLSGTDAQCLKDDLEQMRLAHEDDLHSTHMDWQQRHRVAEEASENVLRDFQKLHADLASEQLARGELKRKHRQVDEEKAKLQCDLLSLKRDHQKLQIEYEELKKSHAEDLAKLQLVHENLTGDHQKLQSTHAEERRARDEVLVKHEAVESDAQRSKRDLEQMQLAHEEELHSTHADWQQRHCAATDASEKVFKDFQKLQDDRVAEQCAREELERRHCDVEGANAKLEAELQLLKGDYRKLQAEHDGNLSDVEVGAQQLKDELEQLRLVHGGLNGDYQKLHSDHQAEKSARAAVLYKHEVVESDAQLLKQDLEKMRLAHQDELHSTRMDWQTRHRAAEDASEKVAQDILRLEIDRAAEQRAREDLDRKLREVDADKTKLLAELNYLKVDHQRLQAEHDSEKRAHTDVLHKHGAIESDAERLNGDLAKLKLAHEEELHCTHTDWQKKHRTAEEASERVARDFERLSADRAAAQRAQEELEQRNREIEADNKRLQAEAQYWQKRHDNAQTEVERAQTETKAKRQFHIDLTEDSELEGERRIANALRVELNEIRSELQRTHLTHAAKGNLDQSYQDKIALLDSDAQDLRRQLLAKESNENQCEQLRSDLQHMENSKNLREQSAKSLRQSLEKEHCTVNGLRAELADVKKKQPLREDSIRTTLLESELRSVRAELLTMGPTRGHNEQLLSDLKQMEKAGCQREESVRLLRKMLEDERRVKDELRAEVEDAAVQVTRERHNSELLKLRCDVIQKDYTAALAKENLRMSLVHQNSPVESPRSALGKSNKMQRGDAPYSSHLEEPVDNPVTRWSPSFESDVFAGRQGSLEKPASPKRIECDNRECTEW